MSERVGPLAKEELVKNYQEIYARNNPDLPQLDDEKALTLLRDEVNGEVAYLKGRLGIIYSEMTELEREACETRISLDLLKEKHRVLNE